MSLPYLTSALLTLAFRFDPRPNTSIRCTPRIVLPALTKHTTSHLGEAYHDKSYLLITQLGTPYLLYLSLARSTRPELDSPHPYRTSLTYFVAHQTLHNYSPPGHTSARIYIEPHPHHIAIPHLARSLLDSALRRETFPDAPTHFMPNLQYLTHLRPYSPLSDFACANRS